jgi:sucrose phosphorylase
VEETGRARSINREKFSLASLEAQLADGSSRASQVFQAYTHLLKIRKGHPAFKPLASQQILDLNERVFALLRAEENHLEKALCLINVSSSTVPLTIDPALMDPGSGWVDILTDMRYIGDNLTMDPYQVLWLKEV